MGSCVSVPERRIVILGRKGDGKSSAGNTILGKKVFTPKASGDSVKAICEIRKKTRYGSKITVIESPGFFDTDHDDKEMKSEILKALVECAQGVDAFVIVVKVGEYTSQEMKVLQRCLKTLKEDVFDHTVILFTFGKQLEDQTIEEFLKANSQLQKLIDKCGGRCHVIDNKYWKKHKRGNKSNKVQVKNLLETIAKMRHKNGCYSNELFQKIEKQIQEEIGKMGGENLPPEEKRENAKKNAQEKKNIGAGCRSDNRSTDWCSYGHTVCGTIAAILAFLQMTFPLRALINVAAAVVGVGGAREAETGVIDPEEAEVKTGEKAGGTSRETGEKAGEAAVEAVRAAVAGGAGIAVPAGVLGAAAAVGAVGGGVIGWKAAEEADSVYDAMMKAAQLNYEKATAAAENIQQFVGNVFSNKAQSEEKKIIVTIFSVRYRTISYINDWAH